MRDISIYFRSLNLPSQEFEPTQLGSIIQSNQFTFPELTSKSIALIYVPEYRLDTKPDIPVDLEGTVIRQQLYSLQQGVSWNTTIFDLGNLLPGQTPEDTFFALSQVVEELVKNRILPIVIGGSQDLTFGIYKGFERLEQLVNLCCVDYQLDLGAADDELQSNAFVSKILLQRPCVLFNHANIGLQAPFVNPKEWNLFDQLFFDSCRLGEFNQDFRKAEPHLRNADILSFDLTSIRASEFQSNAYSHPNGFYADQACQIAKYAGISDKLNCFGVFNYYSSTNNTITEGIISQLIWYFIDGFEQRKGDFPVGSKKDYMRFTVHLDDFQDEIVFYKSNKSERWWMEVPYPEMEGKKYERQHMVPCDQEDYESAMKNELPNLWWKTYQKLS